MERRGIHEGRKRKVMKKVELSRDEYINRITDEGSDFWTCDLQALARECNVDHYYLNIPDDEVIIRAKYLAANYCTDTLVGEKAYFLDGELVAISKQFGRKYKEEFSWVSKEARKVVRDYLLSRFNEDEPEIALIGDSNDLYYYLAYVSDLLEQIHTEAYYGDKLCKLIREVEECKPQYKVTWFIEVDGEKKQIGDFFLKECPVDIGELTFRKDIQ